MPRNLDPIPEAEQKRIVACYKTMTLRQVAARFHRDQARIRQVLLQHGVKIGTSAQKQWA
jgi:hypothetical protein